MKTVDFNQFRIRKAIEQILSGEASKVHISSNAKVYECKDIIRIDLKVKEKE